MARRFQINDHRIAYEFIVARDGEHCIICGRKPPAVKLQIDHADKNPDNNKPENLHLICQQHNLEGRKFTPKEHLKRIQTATAKNVCMRVSVCGNETTHQLRELVDYKSGTVEMQANSYCETVFREWLTGELKRLKTIEKQEVISSGAEVCGCSIATINRYLSKMTSSVGTLKESKDNFGTKIISLKPSKPPRF